MQPLETEVNVSSLTENHGVPGRIRVPPPPQIAYLSAIRASPHLVTGLFCACECSRVPPGGCQRGCQTAPVAILEDRSSGIGTPSARRVGTGARRMPSSRKFEYEKLHCPGHMPSGLLMHRKGIRGLAYIRMIITPEVVRLTRLPGPSDRG